MTVLTDDSLLEYVSKGTKERSIIVHITFSGKNCELAFNKEVKSLNEAMCHLGFFTIL